MEVMESMSIYSKRKRHGKNEDKVIDLEEKSSKPPSHVSFADSRSLPSFFAAQALTPKRHCNFTPSKPKPVFGDATVPTSCFTSTKTLPIAIKEETQTHLEISRQPPHSPPSTPFRFNSFPASLPRVHPRQKNCPKTPKFLLRKRPTDNDDSFDFSQDQNVSHDTINTSISSISVGSPVSMKRCESPTRWDVERVPVQLFLGDESDKEEEVPAMRLDFNGATRLDFNGATRLNFNSLLSPEIRVEKNEEDITPIQESKDLLKHLPTNDLTHTYDTTRTSSFPSCSTPPRYHAHSILDQSSITRQEKFHYDTAQCSPIHKDDCPPSPWDHKDSLSLSRLSDMSSSRKHRPMPDMTAFDASSTSSPLKVICPPTPVRTPAWAHNEPLSPDRKDSLITSKILAGCPTSENGFSSFDHSMMWNVENDQESDDRDYALSKEQQQQETNCGTISFHENFDVLGQIGSGSFADVYKVRCKSTGALYAVKRNRRQFRGKRDRELALGEVRTMQKLQNEVDRCRYLLFFVRAWQEDGYFFCQTELCCRDSCRNLIMAVKNADMNYPSSLRFLDKRIIPQSSIWKICHDVAAGLDHIHSHGMVHYDIKPSNIFFAVDEVLGCICKIGDFGIAGDIGSSEDGQEGDTKYMPQELLASGVKHPSADLFSFGLTLYELASDLQFELPTEGRRWHEIRNNADTLVYPKERDTELLRIIKKMVDPDNSKRPKAENILSINEVKNAGAIRDAFLAAYIKDVQDIDSEREKELAAAQKEANLRRSTPTNSIMGSNSRVTDFEPSWSVRTPTPELFPKCYPQQSSCR